ncbi:MAG: 2-dehydropantoate 2-reductase, partial [Verrucomicrobia bacterium]|nr:2-dehydropantoate 2-reductase [Verrucomicrobiota bacterium]
TQGAHLPLHGRGVAGTAGQEAVVTGDVSSPATRTRGGCLTTDKLLADPRWEQLVRELMLEVIATARALGHDVETSLAAAMIERTRTMGAYKASTLVAFDRGRPLDLEGLFFKPLRQARQADVPTPRLQSLCMVLQRLGSSSA